MIDGEEAGVGDPERRCGNPDLALAVGLTIWTVLVFTAGTCLGALVIAWARLHP